MRIAIDARLIGGTNTGDSTYWTCMVDAFSRLNSPIELLLFSNSPRPPKVPVGITNYRWIHVPASKSRWWSLVKFPLAVRKMRLAGAHTQYSVSPLLGAKCVSTVHDMSVFVGPEWFSQRDREVLRRTIPAACRQAKRIITVSETSAAEVVRYVPESAGKVRVTPNACPPWIRPIDPARAAARRLELGVPDQYVLTVGTRWARKNMDLAVQAADLLPKELRHKLVITGKPGEGRAALGARGLATGYVDEEALCALYMGAAAYLAPSRHEGFGIPALEAMKCGTPVMVGLGGAFPEVVGEAGIVMKTFDPTDWASRLAQLLRDSEEQDRLVQLGYQRETDFTWDASAKLTEEVYREAFQ